jgi:hypothetical protein
MDTISFIMAVEDGSISQEDFLDNVQEFVDTGVWRSLQGFWQRSVHNWECYGYCVIR